MAVCLVNLRPVAFVTAVFTVVCFVMSGAAVYAQPDVSASCAALMVAETGELIYGKNEHDRRPMASTTKIMTSLLAIEALTPQREIKVSVDMLNVEGTSMGLLPGDTVTLEGLVYGMLLQSGNDAANVTAATLGGSVENFVSVMNKRAAEIGMRDTHFETPSGLDSKEHYSTAYDMALLGCTAIKNPRFAAVCSQKSAAVCYGNPPYRRTLTNHNRLLRIYDDAIGIKTGFTKKSGRCLVSAARRDGVTLVAVTLNAPDDWSDHSRLLEYGFSLVERREADTDLSALSLKIAGGESESVPLKLSRPLQYISLKNKTVRTERKISLKRFEYAPIEENTVVGSAELIVDGKVADRAEILTAGSVQARKSAPELPKKEKSRIKRLIKRLRDLLGNWM